MKIFGLGRDKPVSFNDFCDVVRHAVRKSFPGAGLDRTENGFILTIDDKPITCHLRSLYATYHKKPGDRDRLIKEWMSALATPVPTMTWNEARLTLRPQLKESGFLKQADLGLGKQGDSLPAAPFVGDLSSVVVRDLGGVIAFVTQLELKRWEIAFEKAMEESLNNMNLLNFPPITNSLYAGGSSGRNAQSGDVVGVVFEGDYLTATWLLAERFRDFLVQRLQGDCFVSVPHRRRLVAVRADEPGLVNSIVQSNRNFHSDTHALTPQCYHISSAGIGGNVTVWQAGPFANVGYAHTPPTTVKAPPPEYVRPQPIDLSTWGGLRETTDAAPPPTPGGANDAKRRR